MVLDRFLPSPDMKTIRINGRTPSVEPITRFQEALGKLGFDKFIAEPKASEAMNEMYTVITSYSIHYTKLYDFYSRKA